MISEDYDNCLDVFSKKNSDIFLSYQKYDHKIILKKKSKHDYTILYKML